MHVSLRAGPDPFGALPFRAMFPRIAYRLVTDRLELRCWHPSDAAALLDVITKSKPALEVFLPWARLEPTTLDQKIELLRTFRGRFDLGHDYAYGVFLRSTGEIVGGNGLMPRIGPAGLEIATRHAGLGYCTEGSAALAHHALVTLGVDRVEIHCEPQNGPSNAIPKKLGFEREATLRRRYPFTENDLRDTVVWSLFRDRLPRADRVNWARYEAFDSADRKIL
jgi:RimJ/RimL family protein N-acetyltransferase